MESESIKSAEERTVPDELLQRLHVATERFHRAKELMEQSVGDTETSHQEKVDQATDQMRMAEREVEAITLQIQSSLASAPPISQNH